MKVATAPPEYRMEFAQKVYGIVALQLGVTAIMCYLAMTYEGVLLALANPALILLSIITEIVLTIVLICSKEMRSTVPKNYILLMLFTIAEGHLVAIGITAYDRDIIGLACIITAGVFLILTGYAIGAKKDYTMAFDIFITLLIASLLIGIIKFFFACQALSLLYSFVGILISCFYILYDTQMIFGGYRREFDIDDYIIAALNIYLDIIILFFKILKFLDSLKEKEKKKE